jgi:hypothetical protein
MAERESWEELADDQTYPFAKEEKEQAKLPDSDLEPQRDTACSSSTPKKPPLLLSSHNHNDDDWLRKVHPYFESQPKVILLKRESAPKKFSNHAPPPSPIKIQTLEEREKKYIQARAIIFNQK